MLPLLAIWCTSHWCRSLHHGAQGKLKTSNQPAPLTSCSPPSAPRGRGLAQQRLWGRGVHVGQSAGTHPRPAGGLRASPEPRSSQDSREDLAPGPAEPGTRADPRPALSPEGLHVLATSVCSATSAPAAARGCSGSTCRWRRSGSGWSRPARPPSPQGPSACLERPGAPSGAA